MAAMNESELKHRTKQFALRTIKLVSALRRTAEGRVMGAQLIRSGTSVGANYRAAWLGDSGQSSFLSLEPLKRKPTSPPIGWN